MARWKRRTKYYINSIPSEITYPFYFKRIIVSPTNDRRTDIWEFDTDPSLTGNFICNDDKFYGDGWEYGFGTFDNPVMCYYSEYFNNSLVSEETINMVYGSIGGGALTSEHYYYTNFDVTDQTAGGLVPKIDRSWMSGKIKYYSNQSYDFTPFQDMPSDIPPELDGFIRFDLDYSGIIYKTEFWVFDKIHINQFLNVDITETDYIIQANSGFYYRHYVCRSDINGGAWSYLYGTSGVNSSGSTGNGTGYCNVLGFPNDSKFVYISDKVWIHGNLKYYGQTNFI